MTPNRAAASPARGRWCGSSCAATACACRCGSSASCCSSCRPRRASTASTPPRPTSTRPRPPRPTTPRSSRSRAPTTASTRSAGRSCSTWAAFGYVVVALMGMFLVGRHTRADEENGRTELLRAAVLGRNAPVTAVLVVAAAAFAVLGALIALSLHEPGPPHRGLGRLRRGDGRVRPDVRRRHRGDRAGHRAQPHRARAPPARCSAASYVIRAIGDIGDGTLSWLSPMGWARGPGRSPASAGGRCCSSPGRRWSWSAWPTRCWTSATSAAGWCRPAPAPPTASPALTRPLGFAVRLQRGTVIAWAAALALTGVAYGSVGKDVGDLIGDNDAFEDIIAQAGGSLTDSFFTTSLLMLALITGGFAVSSALRLRGEETGGRAEVLLATARVARPWAASHLAVALGGSAVDHGARRPRHGRHVRGDRRRRRAGRAARRGGRRLRARRCGSSSGVTFALFGLAPRADGRGVGGARPVRRDRVVRRALRAARLAHRRVAVPARAADAGRGLLARLRRWRWWRSPPPCWPPASSGSAGVTPATDPPARQACPLRPWRACGSPTAGGAGCARRSPCRPCGSRRRPRARRRGRRCRGGPRGCRHRRTPGGTRRRPRRRPSRLPRCS